MINGIDMKNMQIIKAELNHNTRFLIFTLISLLTTASVHAITPSLYIPCDSILQSDSSGFSHDIITPTNLSDLNLTPGVKNNAWVLNSGLTSLKIKLKPPVALQPENSLSFWFSASHTDDITIVSSADHQVSIELKSSRLILNDGTREFGSLGTTLPVMSDTFAHVFVLQQKDFTAQVYLNGELIIHEKLSSSLFKGGELYFGAQIQSESVIPGILTVDEIALWSTCLSRNELDGIFQTYNFYTDSEGAAFSQKYLVSQLFEPSTSDGNIIRNLRNPSETIELLQTTAKLSRVENRLAIHGKDNKYSLSVPFSYEQADFSMTFQFVPEQERASLSLVTLPVEGASYLAINCKSGTLEGVYYFGRKEKTIHFINNPEVSFNTWQTLKLIYSAKDSTYFIYLNDGLIGEIPSIGKPDASQPLYFGTHPRIEHKALPAAIGTICIYQTLLPASADLNSFLSPKHVYKTTNIPVIFQNFEPFSRQYAFDHQLTETSKFTDPSSTAFDLGILGFALNLSNSKNALIIPGGKLFDVIDDFTFSLWIKPSSFGDKRKIISKRDPANSKRFLILSEDQGYLLFGTGDGKEFSIVKSASPISPNEWTHLAGVFSTSDKSLSLYINGSADTTVATSVDELNLSGQPFTIGADFEGNSDHFEGLIDELLLFNTALSSSEIRPLFARERYENKRLKISDSALKNYKAKQSEKIKAASLGNNASETKNVSPQKNIPSQSGESSFNAFKVFEKTMTLKDHQVLAENLIKERSTNHDSSSFIYSKVSHFKEMKITSQISFENKELKYIDLINPATSLQYESASDKKPVLGVTGLGCHIDEKSFLKIGSLKTHPYVISFSFWIKPLESAHMKSFFSLKSEGEPIVTTHMMKNFMHLLPVAGEGKNLNLYLVPNIWQQLAITLDIKNQVIKCYKNSSLVSQSAFTTDQTLKNVELIIGRDQNQYTFPMIIDEFVSFQEPFTASALVPLPPLTPFMSIREKNSIRSDQIKVTLYAQNAAEMIISDSPDFIGGKWKPYAPTEYFSTIQVTGPHRIYAKFKNEIGVESEIISDTYHYQGSTKGIIYKNPIPDKIIPGKR